ncbi:MAG: hypothetical protein IKY83_08545 [Proteobacteria bacterium]|nr:hypothetical protein [Pseudomonadota bacterium]
MKTLLFGSLISSLLLTGCMLLTPEDPPHEPKDLKPDDFAWDEIDIARDYKFIDVTRIDCGSVRSNLSGSGKCLPVKLPFATSALQCPLSYPAETLTFACIDKGDIPAVYVRFSFAETAKNIDLTALMPCEIVSDGPAAHKPPRFPTDPGYHACLCQNTGTPGALINAPDTLRPAGIYIDLTAAERSEQSLHNLQQNHLLDGPFDIVLDARFLDEDARTQAFKNLPELFSFYRNLEIHPNIHTAPKPDNLN